MITLTRQQARITMIVVRFTLGILSWFLPTIAARIMLIDPKANPALSYPLQLFGARDVVLGILILDPQNDKLNHYLQIGLIIDLCDVAASGIAGLKGQIPKRSAILCFCAGLVGASVGAAALGKGPLSGKTVVD